MIKILQHCLILVLLLSLLGMILLCTSVYLLLIQHAKWSNEHKSRDSKRNTVPYRTTEQIISWEFSENLDLGFPPSLDGYFQL